MNMLHCMAGNVRLPLQAAFASTRITFLSDPSYGREYRIFWRYDTKPIDLPILSVAILIKPHIQILPSREGEATRLIHVWQ